MLITPDLSEAAEGASGPIPSGVYNARIEKVEQKKSQKGLDYLSWKLKIFGADGDLAKYNNWPVFYSTMLSGPGAGMLKTFVKAATGEELTGSFDATALYGKEVQLTLTQGLKPDGSVSDWPNVKGVKAIN